MKPERDDEFAREIKEALRESEERIDELTLARLRAARHRAVAAHREQSRFELAEVLTLDWLNHHRLFALLVAATLLAAMWLFSAQRHQQQRSLAPMFEDLELLSGSDDFELYRDLDFYLWIDNEKLDVNEPVGLDTARSPIRG